MAARKTTVSPDDETPPASFEHPGASMPAVFSDEVPDDIALANVLADLGGESDAEIKVYIVEPGKGNAYVGTYDTASFSLELIKQTHGPGEYRVHVRRDGKLYANRMIRIAASKTPQIPAQFPQQKNEEISKLAESMNQGFQAIGNMLANSIQALAANQPKPKTTQELLQEMLTMKQLLGVGVSRQDNSMELFLKGLEFAKEITPREGEPGTGEIILEAIKNFGGLLKQKESGNFAPAPIASVMAVPGANITMQNNGESAAFIQPAPQQAAQPSPQPSPDDSMNLARKMYLNLLLSNAKADNDPMTYAAMAVDLQGEDKALEFARRPDWFELLCSELPEAAQYRDWFTEMRNAIFTLTEQPNPDIQVNNTDSSAPANPENATDAHSPNAE